MASNVRQNRTLEAYCCLRGLENEVTSDFCLAPFLTLNIFLMLLNVVDYRMKLATQLVVNKKRHSA